MQLQKLLSCNFNKSKIIHKNRKEKQPVASDLHSQHNLNT
jgi:hypothetical protein